MNTKNEQVSSGLKVLCYMSEQFEFALFSEPPNDPMYDDMFPVVRLSDAEAIIAAKDVEIRQWRVLAHQEHGYVLAENRKQAERIKELEADVAHWRYQADEAGMMRVRYGNEIAKQSAALKLAREAIVMWQNCILFEPSVSACERKSEEALAEIDALGEEK